MKLYVIALKMVKSCTYKWWTSGRLDVIIVYFHKRKYHKKIPQKNVFSQCSIFQKYNINNTFTWLYIKKGDQNKNKKLLK